MSIARAHLHVKGWLFLCAAHLNVLRMCAVGLGTIRANVCVRGSSPREGFACCVGGGSIGPGAHFEHVLFGRMVDPNDVSWLV